MVAITHRVGLDRNLTAAEVDANFDALNAGKQDTLVSATNIKTVNGSSLVGAGDVTISTTFQGGTLTLPLNYAATVDIASAATVNLGGAGSNAVNITGTTTITAFDSISAGSERSVTFAGILTLTHNAVSLILPGGVNLSTAAGDAAVFRSLGGGNWKCISYTRANGQPVVGGSGFTGGTLSSPINDAPEVTVSSASTTDSGGAGSNQVTISGTTTILGLGTIASGASRRVTFSGVLTLTHNASSLILPGAANITTAANDTAEFQSLGAGNWRCIDYQRANGQAITGGAFTGGTMTTAVNEAPIATLASASTVNIGASVNSISISGTTTITAFDTIASGAIRRLVFQGILTLTHNGTSLILPQATNITTAAGDVAEFVSLGSGNWRCFNYMRATGTPIGAAPITLVNRPVSGTSDTLLATDNGGVVDYTNAGAIAVAITTAFNGCCTQLTWPASAGTITITATGVTLNGGASLVLSQALGSVAILPIGTNAFRVVGSIGDLTAADITDLAAGVASFLTTPTSANLAAALTNESGTSSVVFSTRPTITGPIFKVNSLPTSNDTYDGTAILGLSTGYTSTIWDPVYVAAAGTMLLADADGSGTFPCRGLVAAGVASAAADLLVIGVARHDAWTWTIGGDIFFSTAGALTQTAPAVSGNKVQKIGWAVTADSIFVNCGSAEYLTVT